MFTGSAPQPTCEPFFVRKLLQTGWPVGYFTTQRFLSTRLPPLGCRRRTLACAGSSQMPAKTKLTPRRPAQANKADELTVERYLARESDIDCRIIDAAAALFR